MWYPVNTPPDGWLECNGQSTASYPALAALIGPSVPDLRGVFIRGLDTRIAGNVDPWSQENGGTARSIRSIQIDNFKSHTHGSNSAWVNLVSFHVGDAFLTGVHNSGYDFDYGNTVKYTGGIETRPRNIALLPCIKY